LLQCGWWLISSEILRTHDSEVKVADECSDVLCVVGGLRTRNKTKPVVRCEDSCAEHHGRRWQNSSNPMRIKVGDGNTALRSSFAKQDASDYESRDDEEDIDTKKSTVNPRNISVIEDNEEYR
jgi:hypothetical protein